MYKVTTVANVLACLHHYRTEDAAVRAADDYFRQTPQCRTLLVKWQDPVDNRVRIMRTLRRHQRNLKPVSEGGKTP